ncbi:DUF3551 domain-containing protein [Bradyrhizobium yuanmingense]|uniref:DUF3551 domain-containing protein n=1 Tax=Bradyrhizobium yuanmingense TaxID=108015 RepID=UPI0023B9B5B1|nr:DUF3551 domain-containing protein [Bradyrhizobium yuanmingense]MDF0493712.1 DUF3551 domain-containing protein [Bradyrhizobium yuanmingense]
MERLLGFAAIVAVSTAAAILIPIEPDAAKESAVCRLDYDSGVSSCTFETIDQCVATIAGRGGSCSRSTGSEVDASFAQKMHARHRH